MKQYIDKNYLNKHIWTNIGSYIATLNLNSISAIYNMRSRNIITPYER